MGDSPSLLRPPQLLADRATTRDTHRIRTIIISAPFLVASSLLLYKRLYLGEEQKRLPPPLRSGVPVAEAVQAPTLGNQRRDELEGVPADVARRIRDAEDQARR